MNSAVKTALHDLYRSWSDEQLVRATVIERDQYEAEAVAEMLRELDQRGVSAHAAREMAASLPPEPASEPTGPKRVTAALASYLKSSAIALLAAAAALAGLALAELGTRALTHSETYYQTHSMPRLWGAFTAFVFSFATLQGAAWLLRRTGAKTDPMRDDREARAERSRAVLARVRYVPLVIFGVCLLAALSPR